jgi:hypothetical protein
VSQFLCLIGLPHIVTGGAQVHILDVYVVVSDIDDLTRSVLDVGVAFGVGARDAIDTWERWVEFGIFIHDARYACLRMR